MEKPKSEGLSGLGLQAIFGGMVSGNKNYAADFTAVAAMVRPVPDDTPHQQKPTKDRTPQSGLSNKAVGSALRIMLRNINGLTQQTVADTLGITRMSLSRTLKGQRVLTKFEFGILAEKFGLDSLDLEQRAAEIEKNTPPKEGIDPYNPAQSAAGLALKALFRQMVYNGNRISAAEVADTLNLETKTWYLTLRGERALKEREAQILAEEFGLDLAALEKLTAEFIAKGTVQRIKANENGLRQAHLGLSSQNP